MTFVSINPSAGCTVGATIDCNIGALAAGASITYSLVGNIPAATPAGTVFSNTANVTSANDPNSENDSSTTALTVSSVDMGVVKSAPATAVAGTTMSYTVTMTNNGPDAAINARFADPLPPGTTFVSVVQNTGPASFCSGPGIGTQGTVSCSIGVMGGGVSAQFTINVGVGNVASITNTATVSSDSFDPNSMNNSSSASTTVTQTADLSITKTAPATAIAGTNITYTLSVANGGPSSASTVALTDNLPASVTFVSMTAPAGWATNTPAVGSTGTITLEVRDESILPDRDSSQLHGRSQSRERNARGLDHKHGNRSLGR